MNITYREFIHSSLIGARFLDAHHPRMRAEENMWRMFEFSNDAVFYVTPEYRNARNAGALMFEILLTNCEPRGYAEPSEVIQ